MNHDMLRCLESYRTVPGYRCNATHVQEVEKESTGDPQEAVVNPFPFLRLPSEIRNMIYRLLLVTRYVTIDEPRANYACKDLGQGLNGYPNHIGEVEIGTIRCDCWRTYNLGFQVSILGTSQQINREAWPIFEVENLWTIVRVNKAGFGQQMKARGFPVATNNNQFHHIKLPFLKVAVTFPSLEGENQSDVLLLAAAHLNEFTRALWTTKGSTKMEISMEVQQLPLIKSPPETDLLLPFKKLRRTERVCVWSAADEKYVDIPPRGMNTTEDLIQTYYELSSSLRCLHGHIDAGEWRQAISLAEEHCMVMSDIRVVYGSQFIGLGIGLNLEEAFFRSQSSSKIIISTAWCMAQINLHMGQFPNCIRFADHAIYVSGHSQSWAVPDECMCSVFLTRARAYIGMEHSMAARADIQEARKLNPDSRVLKSVLQAWEAEFGPFPEPADGPVVVE